MSAYLKFLITLILVIFTANSSRGLELTTVKVAGGGFAQPLFLTSSPGDTSRLFILEQNTATIKIRGCTR